MRISWVAENWNDILTLFAVLTTMAIGYFQIQYYRNESGAMEVDSINRAVFDPVDTTDPWGDPVQKTTFQFDAKLRNTGRQPVYILDITSNETVCGEILEFRESERQEERGRIKLGSKELATFEFAATVSQPLTNSTELKVPVAFETSNGEVHCTIPFHQEK